MSSRIVSLVFSIAIASAADGDLPRRGDFGATFRVAQSAAEISAIAPGGFANHLGLKVGDVIRAINDTRAAAFLSLGPAAGTKVHLEITRENRPLDVAGALPESPRESYPNVDVIYDSVTDAAGNRLRTIVTHPKTSAPLVTVLVAGWLSCDGIEAPPETRDATSLVFRELARQPQIVLVRMDKPGTGDSLGGCGETDFQTELSGCRAAFTALSRYSFVDPQPIVIFGISNGGGFAPLVAGDAPVAGYLIVGGWMKTWFEHMLEIERRRLALSGKSPGEVNAAMAAEAELYTDYLICGQNPADIIPRKPELKDAWVGDDAHLYGRPIRYYQQLQRLKLFRSVVSGQGANARPSR